MEGSSPDPTQQTITILGEPREMHFAVISAVPEVPMDIEVSRLPDQRVLLSFQNVRMREFYDMSWLERGLYAFSIRASNGSSLLFFQVAFTVNGPPRDMVYLSLLLGLTGILVFILPEFAERRRETRSK
jgi:hypothetical protein